MAGLTLEHAEAQLALWLAADSALAGGAQSYRIETAPGTSRQVTRADAAQIQRNIDFWDQKCRQLGRSGGIVVRGVTFAP
ncbi:MAG TPA: hypothetical protein DCS42_06275 [Nitrospiraceae bacterium]|nr:hypothetical protein [Nitrospiraceae bacterium]